ncbi:fungal-specific transcription factor domain-containing protein [Aspergillus karnatakaensis]|uniref:fungal specific transcription factor domain-containing protein n=1 Tax=Aspergillus karnatakaensis TaxID=1810916 RepID=UPI003CCD5770
MKSAASRRKDSGPHSRPIQGTRSEMRGNFRSRTPATESAGSRRRKQSYKSTQPQESQCVVFQEPEQPAHKKLKMTNDLNGYRRQRNMKNMMMITRLETNIGRLESHLQELGFDLSNLGNDGDLKPPEHMEAIDDLRSPPSTSFGSEHISTEDQPSQADAHTSSRFLHTALPNHGRDTDLPDVHDAGYDPFPHGFGGLFIPRCLLDTRPINNIPALSHEGLEWMRQRAGIAPRLSSGSNYTTASFGTLSDDFPRKVYCPLPPEEEASSLLYEYLQNFNSLCPLFEQAKLVSLFGQGNFNIALETAARWACINVVLALAIAFRMKSKNSAQAEHQRSWLFIKNAFGTLHDLCLAPPDMWSIQALLGMAVFFLGTMSAEPCSFLATAAIRMIHHIGLGNGEDDAALTSEDIKHRRNIFWIAYCLDREISLRFGKPPTQSDDDMCIDLPIELMTEVNREMPSLNRHGGFDSFRAQCRLATIKGRLYRDLYSATARDRTLSEILTSVGALDEMLQKWREDLPLEYQPAMQGAPHFPSSSISVTLLFLHYSYFDCIISMHRLIASHGIQSTEDLLKRKDLNILTSTAYDPKVFASGSLCASAARASIRLMRYMPEGHISLVGILLHYPMIALRTLSSTIVQNPLEASRLTDMKLMDQVEALLSSLVVSIPSQVITQLKEYCATYRAAANAAIQKTMTYCGP